MISAISVVNLIIWSYFTLVCLILCFGKISIAKRYKLATWLWISNSKNPCVIQKSKVKILHKWRETKLQSIRLPTSGQKDKQSVNWRPMDVQQWFSVQISTIAWLCASYGAKLFHLCTWRTLVQEETSHKHDNITVRASWWKPTDCGHSAKAVLWTCQQTWKWIADLSKLSQPILYRWVVVVGRGGGGLLMQQVALWKMIMHSNRESETERERERDPERVNVRPLMVKSCVLEWLTYRVSWCNVRVKLGQSLWAGGALAKRLPLLQKTDRQWEETTTKRQWASAVTSHMYIISHSRCSSEQTPTDPPSGF